MKNYEGNNIIAYIDILGYKNIIDKEPERHNNIVKILTEEMRLKRGSERYGSASKINHIGFADSLIFISEEIDKDNFNKNIETILKTCQKIQKRLLKNEFLLRGSICFGRHKEIISENITYYPSETYIKAVVNESNITYPIITIDHDLFIHIDEQIRKNYLVKDQFNKIFINYIGGLTHEEKDNIQKMINSNKSKSDQRVVNKYLWLDAYLKWSYAKSINMFEIL